MDVTNPTATGLGTGEDLLLSIKKDFNARHTLHYAIDTVRTIGDFAKDLIGGFLEIKHKEEDDLDF